jgi:deazaflavin-dependent oxidoreductase (nitroreductase family)
VLSATQLPFFLVRPPRAYGVLTTVGRKTGRRRRRCVRAVRTPNAVVLVAIKGTARTGWVKNALAAGDVELRLPGETVRGRARLAEPGDAELLNAYTSTVAAFDRLTYLNWRTGAPRAAAIRDLLRSWVREGQAVVVEL